MPPLLVALRIALEPAQMLGEEIVRLGERAGGCEIKNDWFTWQPVKASVTFKLQRPALNEFVNAVVYD